MMNLVQFCLTFRFIILIVSVLKLATFILCTLIQPTGLTKLCACLFVNMHNRTGYYGTILYTSLTLLMSIIIRWGLRGLPTSSETDTKHVPSLVVIALSAFVVNSSASCCVQTTLSKTNSEVNFPHKTIGVCNSTPKACLCILHSRNIYSIEHISSLCRGHPLVGVIGL